MVEGLGVAIPNHKVEWTLHIVTYPFLSGIAAGATVISLMVYFFGRKDLMSLERVGHLLALSCMLVAPLAPLFDLTMPSRGFLVPFYPNTASPIFLFFVFWTIFVVVMLLKSYFLFRRDFIRRAQEGDLFGRIAGILTFGAKEVDSEKDERKVKLLTLLAFPLAFAFTGYVGFLLSSMQAIPMWGTHILIPVFLVSAVVSGIGAALLLYVVGGAIVGAKVRTDNLRAPVLVMAVFAGIDLLLLFLELILEWYWNIAHWSLVAKAISANMPAYIIAVASLALLFILGFIGVGRGAAGIFLLGVLSLIGIYAMRWITVIPPQMVEKGGLTVVEPHIKIIGRDGLTEVLSLFSLVFFLLLLFSSIAGWRSTQEREEVA